MALDIPQIFGDKSPDWTSLTTIPCTSDKCIPENNRFKLMLDMDHKLSVKHDQGPVKVMYEARTNEQRLSKPDNKRINDNVL